MKTVRFGRNNRSGDLLHVEVPGGIVNIWIGLRQVNGQEVTRIEALPDSEWRGGDEEGRAWHAEPSGSATVIMLVRQPAEKEEEKEEE